MSGVREGLCPTCGCTIPRWTPARIIEALKSWHAEHGRTPKVREWRGTTTDEHPSFETIARVFGTFNNAFAVAGLPFARPARDSYWTRLRIIEAIRAWARTHGTPPRRSDWNKATPLHPHSSTVEDVFGSWNKGLDAAGYFPRGPRGILYANPDRRRMVRL